MEEILSKKQIEFLQTIGQENDIKSNFYLTGGTPYACSPSLSSLRGGQQSDVAIQKSALNRPVPK